MKQFRLKISITLACALISSVALILTPFLLGQSVDQMGHDMDRVVLYLLICLVLYLVSGVFQFFSTYLANHIAVESVSHLRHDLYEKLQNVSLSYLDTTSHGKILSVFTNDSQLYQEGLVQGLVQASSGIFVIVVAAGFMLSINVLLTLVVFLSVPMIFLSAHLINKKASQLFKKQQACQSHLHGVVSEFTDNYELIQTYGYSNQAMMRFDEANSELNYWAERAQALSAITNPTTRLVNNISYIAMGLFGSFVLWRYDLSVGVLTSFIAYGMMFSKPFNEFSAVMQEVSLGKVAYDRIMTLMAMPQQSDCNTTLDMKGDVIEISGASFSYDPSIPLIKDLNLKIKPLSKVAIVGPTGSGKSTLINILMRYYDLNEGSFRIDGVDVETTSRASVRSLMGIVLQDPWLFKGSIYDNIAYGNASSSRSDVERVSQQVGIYDTIMALDEGFESLIGEVKVSAGQMQMITIARALISDAPILILDEATSNIDLVSEKFIQNTFTHIMKSHTSFFVAHRLQTVVDSDLILVMKEGRLVETGSHQELMDRKGFYHQLFMAQI